ncbi:glutaryl-CoA dehydrogenase [Carnobacterium sp. PL12RED10]|uniref:acyl-CoA dehydrogenase FadE n=1 Tax=Carnobacterium sp. PL12RED10 TaxID=2592351 RepID=UPI0011EC7028|nr:acyl-CoA dehydrogenase family protein [Carnobacterium sp. PL12RED10]KAF3300031.1 glutaryl-CoA dehydrogenase [Carnobacterium sp. PL12RED10]
MDKQQILSDLYPEDVYGFSQKLTEIEVGLLSKLRQVLENQIAPTLKQHWKEETFPFEAFKAVGDLGLMNHPDLFKESQYPYKVSEYFNLFRYYELARTDMSLATFMTVHAGLGFTTLLQGGSQEQIDYFAPKFTSFEWQTCFALTEPDHGSDIAGGMATTAVRDGDNWLLNGEKRWIGGAGSADFIPIFARNPENNDILCFMVSTATEGLTVEKIDGKIALRLVQNGHIHLKNVQVAEAFRLPKIQSFRDVSRILYATRADVSHITAGGHAGALRAALKYTGQREQFGKKVSQFQITQEKLARMQANAATGLSLSYRLAELQTEGKYAEVPASIAKMQNARLLRETVALGREICGGNGITVDTEVARYFGDAEAIYSYEGTHEVNSLIIGRHLTGFSAFV